MNKLFKGISLLPALLVLPAMADKIEITERQILNQDTTFDGYNIHGISNGAVGGAIWSGNKIIIKNSDIHNNTSGAAAALYDGSLSAYSDHSGNYSVTIDNSYITYNIAGDFGAVAIFSPNSVVSNSQFAHNAATANYADLGDGAGALMLGSESQTLVYRDVFDGNSSGTVGGAIATRPINYWLDTSYSGKGTNSSAGGKVDIISSQFYNNIAGTRGGGFFNSFYNSANKEGYAFVKDSFFRANDADLGGGIFVEGWTDAAGNNAKLWVENTTFENNAASKGGAIYNESELVINETRNFRNEGRTFTANTATLNGGAIYNLGTLTINGAIFGGTAEGAGNTSVKSGGAIYNAGAMDIDGAKFINNSTTTGDGGAIKIDSADSTVVISIKNSEFIGNTTAFGSGADSGAISIRKGKLVLDNVLFDNNKADEGGAVEQWTNDNYAVIKNSTFKNNESKSAYGALALFGKGGVHEIKNTVFESNHANRTTKTPTAASMGGGALGTGSDAKVVISDNTKFINNTSATEGGAIDTRHFAAGQNHNATLDIVDALFKGNQAGALYDYATGTISASAYVDDHSKGGAINNYMYNSFGQAGYTYVSNTTFESNAAKFGGAVYNNIGSGSDYKVNEEHQVGKMYFADTTFTGNTATTDGGAIYNAGTLAFAGTNTFTGNTANEKANDIHNIGSMEIVNGKTTMDGGISGNGSLTVAENSVLNIGTASITQGSLTLDGTLIANLRDGSSQINITDTFDGTGSLKLTVIEEGTYHVFGNKVFDANKIDVTSSLFDLSWSNKYLIATLKSVDDIAKDNGVSAEAATMASNLTSSSSEALNDLSVRVQEALSTGSDADKQAVEHATKSVHPETEAVVQSVATSVQTTVGNLAASRMSLPTIGRAGGDIEPTGAGFWANGLYNRSEQKDMFTGYTRGFAIGMDGTFNKVFTIGTGYSYSHSDIDATGRDTDIDSYTMFVYAQYKPNQWYANTVLNYTMSDYSEKGSALGVGIVADYDVHAYGARVATGYDFANGITPELGLRYTHIDADDYKNNLGIKNSLKSTDYMTLTLGGKYAHGFKTKYKPVSLFPEVHGLLKYDVLSDKQVAVVTMPGVDSYSISGDRLSRFGVELGLGLTMKYYNADWTLDYDFEVREEYTSHTGRIKWRYNF